MAVRERKNSGPQGLANVRVMTKSVRVEFDNGEVFDMPLDTWDKNRKSGKYVVSLSKDKMKILGLKPVAGQYLFRFDQMGGKQNGVPMNKIQRGGPRRSKDGRGMWMAPDELVFTVLLKVESDGPYKGLTVAANLPYSFAAPTAGNGCDFEDSKRNLRRLETFLRVAGNINIAMCDLQYSPEPPVMLTSLEKRLQTMGMVFMGTTNADGFIDMDSVSAVPADLLPKKTKAKK